MTEIKQKSSWKAYQALTCAAQNLSPSGLTGVQLLMRAAVTFTIHYAIDTTDRLAIELQALERELLAKLEQDVEKEMLLWRSTHDMTYVVENLAKSALRYTAALSWKSITNLMVAAVTFTTQLAEETGRSVPEIRPLERELISNLEAPWTLSLSPPPCGIYLGIYLDTTARRSLIVG